MIYNTHMAHQDNNKNNTDRIVAAIQNISVGGGGGTVPSTPNTPVDLTYLEDAIALLNNKYDELASIVSNEEPDISEGGGIKKLSIGPKSEQKIIPGWNGSEYIMPYSGHILVWGIIYSVSPEDRIILYVDDCHFDVGNLHTKNATSSYAGVQAIAGEGQKVRMSSPVATSVNLYINKINIQ